MTPEEIKEYQSDEATRRRNQALAGMQAAAAATGVAALGGPSPNAAASAGVGLAEGVPDIYEAATQ